MSQALYLDAVRQGLRGERARLYGEAYDVHRVTPQVSGSVVSAPPVLRGLPAEFVRTTSKAQVEGALFDALAYVASVDARPLLLGDILIGTKTDTGTYCFAQRRLNKPTICVRCESYATIKRPQTAIDALGDLPPVGSFVAETGSSEVNEATAAVLTLTNGQYAFSDPATPGLVPAIVPIGVQPTARAMGMHAENEPTSTAVARFVTYVPPLGIPLRPNDELEVTGVATYFVLSPSEAPNGELVGTTCLATREGA